MYLKKNIVGITKLLSLTSFSDDGYTERGIRGGDEEEPFWKAKEEQQSTMMKFMLIKLAPERERTAVFQLHLTAEQKAQLPLNTPVFLPHFPPQY